MNLEEMKQTTFYQELVQSLKRLDRNTATVPVRNAMYRMTLLYFEKDLKRRHICYDVLRLERAVAAVFTDAWKEAQGEE